MLTTTAYVIVKKFFANFMVPFIYIAKYSAISDAFVVMFSSLSTAPPASL